MLEQYVGTMIDLCAILYGLAATYRIRQTQQYCKREVTSISVLVILERKCTLVSCCPLVSHVEYALRALLRLEKRERQTDGCQTVTLRLPLDAASVTSK